MRQANKKRHLANESLKGARLPFFSIERRAAAAALYNLQVAASSSLFMLKHLNASDGSLEDVYTASDSFPDILILIDTQAGPLQQNPVYRLVISRCISSACATLRN
jgi:hypothetical protein